MRGRILSLLIGICIVIVLVPVTSSISNATENLSGSCGENITWTFDGQGTLTISGSGEMTDFGWNETNRPWGEYSDSIETVVVEGSVISVGSNAFKDCDSIKKVEIGSSVKTIGEYAFYNCENIDSLTLSEGLERIENEAFRNCHALKTLTVPASATYIADRAFLDNHLEEVTFAEGTTTITCYGNTSSSAGPFSGSYLKKVNFPSTLETIQQRAFINSTNLENVTIPKNVAYIGTRAFESMKGTIAFEEGGSEPLVIDENAFAKNAASSLILPERLTTIGNGAFTGNELTSIHIPKNVTSLSINAFNPISTGASKLTTITVDEDNTAYKAIDGMLCSKDGKTLIMCPRGRSGVLTVPTGIETIGESAFNGCTKLTKVTLPQGLITIEKKAFSYTRLTSITIPKTVTSFALNAFENSTNDRGYDTLRDIIVEEGNAIYQAVNGILYSADGKTLIMCPKGKTGSVTVMDGVENIADNGFSGCIRITEILLPDSLETIGSKAFFECNKLSEIVIPQNVTTIGTSAFAGSFSYRFKDFVSVTIPETTEFTGVVFGSYVENIKEVTVTSENTTVKLTGEDIKLITGNDVESVPTVKELLGNNNIQNPITVTEIIDDVTCTYQVDAGQVSENSQHEVIPADGYCKVLFDTGAKTINAEIIEKGTAVAKPEDPIKEGFTFIGWYGEQDLLNEWDFEETINENITLYAKWIFSVSDIIIDGNISKTYDGNSISLTAEYREGATYQWYSSADGAIDSETERTLILNGDVVDSGNYYCIITVDNMTAKTNTVTINIEKASVEFSVEDINMKEGSVPEELIVILQTTGIDSSIADNYNATVAYTKINGGNDKELIQFSKEGNLLLKLDDKNASDDITYYPILLNYKNPESDAVIDLLSNYNVSFNNQGKLTIKPIPTIVWSESIENECIEVEYTGQNVDLSTDYFTVTNGKTPETVVTGGERTYKYFVELNISGEGADIYGKLIENTLGINFGEKYEFTPSVTGEALIKGLADEHNVDLEALGIEATAEYYVKAVYSGNDIYAETESDYIKLSILPANITVKAKDKYVDKGEDLSGIIFTANDIEVMSDNLPNNLISNIKAALIENQMCVPAFLVSGPASEDQKDGITFKFNINGQILTLDQLDEMEMIPITPSISASIELPAVFNNLIVNFEKGDLIVKEKVDISFRSAGVFALENADSSYGVDKAFITEFTNGDIKLTSDNIVISGIDGKPAPTGEVTIMYRHENDGEEKYGETNYPYFGNYYVKVIVGEDDYYEETVEYAIISVQPAELIIKAADQEIDLNGSIKTDGDAITLQGDILNDAQMNGLLAQALPLLVQGGAVNVSLADAVDTSVAGTYSDGINISFDRNKLEGEYAEAAALFNIKTMPGNLTVNPIEIAADDIKVDGISESYIYTSHPIKPEVVVNVGNITLTENDYTVSYGNNTNVAEGGFVTVALKGNYSGETTCNFAIDKVLATVTADNKEAYIGSSMPELTYTVEGLIGDHTLQVKLECNADMNSIGDTPIVVNAVDPNGNYEINMVNGILTVKNNPYTPSKKPSVPDTPIDEEMECDGEEGCPFHGYTDLDVNAWYHESVDYVLNKGMMNGVGNSKFEPYGDTGRAMIVTILWRLEGEPKVETEEGFNDVRDGLWYSDAIHWASSEGIVEGYEGYFDPDRDISREQAVAILYRYAKYKGIDVSVGEDTNILSYNDSQNVSEWAMDAMQWAVGRGLIEGDGMNLTPKEATSRCQSAALLMRFCEDIMK